MKHDTSSPRRPVPWVSLVVTPLGFALSVFLTHRYFANSQGSGIPQAIAARELDDQVARGRLVSIRIAIGKMLLTLLGLLCGGSSGASSTGTMTLYAAAAIR